MGLVEELEERIKQLEAQLWVARDSALRTYDGLAQKADMADELAEALEQMISSHYNLYLHMFPEGNPEDDIVRREASEALAKYKGEEMMCPKCKVKVKPVINIWCSTCPKCRIIIKEQK
jgi:hypothetical protein